MIFLTPSYYNKFRCSAEKCSDNCCIGWEIEIDSDTAAYYKSLSGPFGDRLRESISDDNSFILKNERCPFLNKNNLCDIIINCSEDRLCQICRDHPKYFNWYGNIKEGGIGLSCEEGARLILENTDYSICTDEKDEAEEEIDEELFRFLWKARENLFSIIYGKSTSINDILCDILSYAEKLQLCIDNYTYDTEELTIEDITADDTKLYDIVSLFSDFEAIDSIWENELAQLTHFTLEHGSCLKVSSEKEKLYLLNLTGYFIHRYFLKGVFDEEILSKVKFAVVSALIIKTLTGFSQDRSVWIEKSKLYSKQMEYSDENRELFYDYTYEKECLSTASLKYIIKKL